MNKPNGLATRRRGFTLIEMVSAVVLLGVISVGMSGFIVLGSRVYTNSIAIHQVLGESRFALERMTREIREAVPNSVRQRIDGTSWQCIEFLPIKTSTSYLTIPIEPLPKANTGTILKSTPSPSSTQVAIVYPLTTAEIYTNPAADTGKIFDINNVVTAGDQTTITFDRPVHFEESSPINRIFFATEPVSYCFESNASGTIDLKRYENYGLNNATQPAPADMGVGILMAQGIENDLATDPPIQSQDPSLINNAMVFLRPVFRAIDKEFQYQQQVQVINVP